MKMKKGLRTVCYSIFLFFVPFVSYLFIASAGGPPEGTLPAVPVQQSQQRSLNFSDELESHQFISLLAATEVDSLVASANEVRRYLRDRSGVKERIFSQPLSNKQKIALITILGTLPDIESKRILFSLAHGDSDQLPPEVLEWAIYAIGAQEEFRDDVDPFDVDVESPMAVETPVGLVYLLKTDKLQISEESSETVLLQFLSREQPFEVRLASVHVLQNCLSCPHIRSAFSEIAKCTESDEDIEIGSYAGEYLYDWLVGSEHIGAEFSRSLEELESMASSNELLEFKIGSSLAEFKDEVYKGSFSTIGAPGRVSAY